MNIKLTQHAGGIYTIYPENSTAAIGFIRRNQKGGGYTLAMKDGRTTTFRNMPKAKNWRDLEIEVGNMIDAVK